MSRWPVVPLGEVLVEQRVRVGTPDADGLPLLGVSNVGGLQRSIRSRIGDMSKYLLVEERWFAYNPMRVNVGSIGWAETREQTGVISPDYVVFSCGDRVEPRLIHLFLTSHAGLRAISAETAGSVRERLYFDALARIRFPLPPLDEQRRLVARIDRVAVRLREIAHLRERVEDEQQALLRAAFERSIAGADYLTMGQVAPLVRRPAELAPEAAYPELGIRSFGRGTFHKPSLSGAELGTKRLFRIEPGDLVFNNVFAWEGAVAVARNEDAGRFGSHRFITCVPKASIASATFLRFYFLTPEGLEKLGKASPGGAGRNRTLGLEALSALTVPVPAYRNQVQFDALQASMDAVKALQAQSRIEGDAVLPAFLHGVLANGR